MTVAGEKSIMTPEETARYLRKSLSWVYKNKAELGGRKLGGSLFFPAKEDLYERIFCQGQRMEVRVRPQGRTVHQGMVQNPDRGKTSRGPKKRGDKKSPTGTDNTNRHGLFGFGKSQA